MTKRMGLFVAVCLLILGSSVVYAASQSPQWVSGSHLVGVFGVSNGDALIISTQSNQIIFTYQYADSSKDNLIEYRTYPFADSFDAVSASVCGKVAHVVTHSSMGNGLYSVSWELPISSTVVYLPIVCEAHNWPNNSN